MIDNNLEIHDRENNEDSQSFKDENAGKFKEACMKVLRLLNQGKRLTVKDAIAEHDIASLPRRIADLREGGIKNIKDAWVKNAAGKRLYKEWWMDIPTRPTKAQVVEMFKNLKPQELNFPK